VASTGFSRGDGEHHADDVVACALRAARHLCRVVALFIGPCSAGSRTARVAIVSRVLQARRANHTLSMIDLSVFPADQRGRAMGIYAGVVRRQPSARR
jgi:hypothetical protein